MRSQIVPKKAEQTDPPEFAGSTPASMSECRKTRRKSWAELLARVFAIDMSHCLGFRSENFKALAAILEISAVKKILTHLGLPAKPPDIALARLPPQMAFG